MTAVFVVMYSNDGFCNTSKLDGQETKLAESKCQMLGASSEAPLYENQRRGHKKRNSESASKKGSYGMRALSQDLIVCSLIVGF